MKGQRCGMPVGTEIPVRTGDNEMLKSQVSPKTAEMAKEGSKSLFFFIKRRRVKEFESILL